MPSRPNRPARLVLATAALLVAAAGSAQTMPSTPVSNAFTHVLASLNLQPGQSASITVPDAYFEGAAPGEMTIYIPVGTFQDPVTFQVLAASNAHWDSLAKPSQKVVANFAYRVYDRKTGKIISELPSPVQYTVADTMIDKNSVYWAVKPGSNPSLVNANAGSAIQGNVLSHPTPTTAVGWIVTTPKADLSMSGPGGQSGVNGSGGGNGM